MSPRSGVLLAPERSHWPVAPAPEIGVLLTRRTDGSWARARITAVPAGVTACRSWGEVDLSSGLYDRLGVVVLDPPVLP